MMVTGMLFVVTVGGRCGGQVNPGFRFDGRCATERSFASLVSGYRGLWLLFEGVAGLGGGFRQIMDSGLTVAAQPDAASLRSSAATEVWGCSLSV